MLQLLYKLLQDFSIYFPFITEEIFQELYHSNPSIHTTEIKLLNYSFEKEIELGNQMIEIISQARGAKTNSNVSLKTPIKNLEIGVNKELKTAIEISIKDFRATLFIENFEMYDKESNFEVKNIELLI